MIAVDLTPPAEPEPTPAPAALPWVPMCTPCLIEAKQAQLRNLTPPEINGAAVIANGMGLCEIRHAIQPPEASQLLIAQPGQLNGYGG